MSTFADLLAEPISQEAYNLPKNVNNERDMTNYADLGMASSNNSQSQSCFSNTDDADVADLLFSSDEDNDNIHETILHAGTGSANITGLTKPKHLTSYRHAAGKQIRLEKIEENAAYYSKEVKRLGAKKSQTTAALLQSREQLALLNQQVDQLDEAIDSLLDKVTTADNALKKEVGDLQNQQNHLLSQVGDIEDHLAVLEEEEGELQSKYDVASEKLSQFTKLKKMAQEDTASDEKVERILNAHLHKRHPGKQHRDQKQQSPLRRRNVTSSRNKPDTGSDVPTATKRVQKMIGRRLQELKIKQVEEQQKSVEEEEHLRQVVLNLKRTIDHVAEQDKRQAVNRMKKKQEKERKEKEEYQKLLTEGKNPAEIKRRRQLEKHKAKHLHDMESASEARQRDIEKRLEKEHAAQRKELKLRTDRLRQVAVASTIHAMEATVHAVNSKFEAEACLDMKEENLHEKQRTSKSRRAVHHALSYSTAGEVPSSLAKSETDDLQTVESIGSRKLGQLSDSSKDHLSKTGSYCDDHHMETPSSMPFVKQQEEPVQSTGDSKAIPHLPTLDLPSAQAMTRQLVEGVDVDFGDDSDEEHESTMADGVFSNGDVALAAAVSHGLHDLPSTSHLSTLQLPEALSSSIDVESAAAILASDGTECLWDPSYDKNRSTQSESSLPIFKSNNRTLSKLESKRLALALQKQKEQIAKPQVVAGREFKGASFVSKPEKVVFADFNIGEIYKQKLVLTNVSYSVNNFHVLPSPMDSISLEYVPSGMLSPGLSTEVTVIFSPKTNRDWSGHLRFASQTGEIVVPISCQRKRAVITLSQPQINLPTICIGEKATAELVLKNTGSLATQYRIIPRSSGTNKENENCNDDESLHENSSVQNTLRSTATSEQKEELSSTPTSNFVPHLQQRPGPSLISRTSEDDRKLDHLTEYCSTSLCILLHGELESVLAPSTEKSIAVQFSPESPGKIVNSYDVVFSEPSCKPLRFEVHGCCVQLPVQISTDNVDLRICQINREFSDSIFITNSSSTSSFKVTFSVPAAARKYLEVKPRTSLAQPRSQSKISLILTPGDDMLRELGPLADPETCLVHIPVTMTTDGFTAKSEVVVHANVTPGDIEVSTNYIDFGRVSFTETVVYPISVTNTSALPQEFAITNCPDFIFIQPNSGFGILLPFETINVDIICCPQRHPHDDDDLPLHCTLHVEWPGGCQPKKIKCNAVGTLPPLRLSSNRIRFQPTCPGDERTVRLYITNVSNKPRTFQFGIPQSSFLDISPICNTIAPGQSQAVWIRYHRPKLSYSKLKSAIDEVLQTKETCDKPREINSETTVSNSLSLIKSTDGSENRDGIQNDSDDKLSFGSDQQHKSRKQTAQPPKVITANYDDDSVQFDFNALTKFDTGIIHRALNTIHPTLESRLLVPCYLRPLKTHPGPESTSMTTDVSPQQLTESTDNSRRASTITQHTLLSTPKLDSTTIVSEKMTTAKESIAPHVDLSECSYLQVDIPKATPIVILLTERGKTSHSFGKVLLGEIAYVTFDLFNVSSRRVSVCPSVLDSSGAFSLTKTLREMPVDSVQSLTIAFSPQAERLYYEQFEVVCEYQTIHFKLFGEGVRPILKTKLPAHATHADLVCSATGQPKPTMPLLMFHDCLKGDRVPAHITLINSCELPINYHICFASQSKQKLKGTIESKPRCNYKLSQLSSALGFNFNSDVVALSISRPMETLWDTVNTSGFPAFYCRPTRGLIHPGEEILITVVFSPDKCSLFYRDTLEIQYSTMVAPIQIDIRGRAWNPGPFVIGGMVSNIPRSDNIFLPPSDAQSEKSDEKVTKSSTEADTSKSKKTKPSVNLIERRVSMVYSLSRQRVSKDPQRASENTSSKSDDISYHPVSYTLLAGIPIIEGNPKRKVTGECVVQPFSTKDIANGFSLNLPNKVMLDSNELLPITICFKAKAGGKSIAEVEQQQSQKEEPTVIAEQYKDTQGNSLPVISQYSVITDESHLKQTPEESQPQEITTSVTTKEMENSDKCHDPKLVPGMKLTSSTVLTLKAGQQITQCNVTTHVAIIE